MVTLTFAYTLPPPGQTYPRVRETIKRSNIRIRPVDGDRDLRLRPSTTGQTYPTVSETIKAIVSGV